MPTTNQRVNYTTKGAAFRKSHPCPICGGYDDRRLGNDRCYGYLSEDGKYANCTQSRRAGAIPLHDNSNTYGHLLNGPCRCGMDHQTGEAVSSERPRGAPDAMWLKDFQPTDALGPIVKAYRYDAADGIHLFAVTRHSPKAFRQWTYNADRGDYQVGLKCAPSLYRLPDIARNPTVPVYVTEGEKDADTLRAWGLVATTAPMGAKKWEPSYSESLRDRDVIFCGDTDEAGLAHQEKACKALDAVAASLTIVTLPARYKDVTEYAEDGHQLADFMKLPRRGDGITCLADVEEEEIDWLWDGHLAFGKITIVDGDPDKGKTVIFGAEIPARLSVGRHMPTGVNHQRQGNSLIISIEDGVADTIKPRFCRAGGDARRMFVMRDLTLPTDVARLERIIQRRQIQYLMIDPIMGCLAESVKTGIDSSVRGALQPLRDMVERTGVVCVLIRHNNKGSGQSAIHQGGGSIAFAGIARIGLMVADDPADDEARVLAVAKLNIGIKPKDAMKYRIVSDGPGTAPYIQWSGSAPYKAADLTRTADSSQRQDIIRTLREQGAPMSPKEVAEALGAKTNNITALLVRMAKQGLIRKEEYGQYSCISDQSDHTSPDHTDHTDHTPGYTRDTIDRDLDHTDHTDHSSSDSTSKSWVNYDRYDRYDRYDQGVDRSEFAFTDDRPAACADAAPAFADAPHAEPAQGQPVPDVTAPSMFHAPIGMRAPRNDYERRIQAKQDEGMGYIEAVRAVDEENRQQTERQKKGGVA